jgi:hypothetical protein
VSGFFNTKEYVFMEKLRYRLCELNTKKNYDRYKEYLEKCKAIAKESYNNIGSREDDDYAWAKFDESKFGVFMISMGDHDDASFYPGHTLYFAEDFSKMSLKDEAGNVWAYSESETKEIKNCTIKELQKIHQIKCKFEGEILSGKKKGKPISKRDKEKAIRNRPSFFL